ncbi:MAG TPA: glycosyltransferase family 39 protein [Polyangia bacterium]|nr:glycosyltransferase family 39 protein [Polyangia bacterium]
MTGAAHEGRGALVPAWSVALLAVIVGAALAATAATHHVFSTTADEPLHVTAGLEFWDGSYSVGAGGPGARPSPSRVAIVIDPPIAQAAAAVGPYFVQGLRSHWRDERSWSPTSTAGPRDVLYQGAGVETNLVSARRGILPFLALALVMTWALGRRIFGDAAGVGAAAALACVPAVLGHAGLATADVAFISMYTLCAFTFLWWLDGLEGRSLAARPPWRRTLVLGLAYGLALASKGSMLMFPPGAMVVAFLREREIEAAGAARPLWRSLVALLAPWRQYAAMLGLTALVVWAAFLFSWASPADEAGRELFGTLVNRCAESDGGRALLTRVLSHAWPAPGFVENMLVLCGQHGGGDATAYLLGTITQQRVPLFFPITLSLKTPLPFAALALVGVVVALRRRDQPQWRALLPFILALVALVVVIPVRINVGVRHVLHLFPMLAVYVGAGVVALWNSARRRPVARATAVGLGAWLVSTPARAAPDYMAWFNGLAGRHPENFLLDSDLDWGQDLFRLEHELAARHVDHVSIAYFGGADLCRARLPGGRWLRPYERATGWIAVSEMYRKGVMGFYYRNGDYCDRGQLVREAPPDPNQFAWLDGYTPVARVGKSILLYDVPPER